MDKKLIYKVAFLLLLFGSSFASIFYFYSQGSYYYCGVASITATVLAVIITTLQLSFIGKMKFIISAIDNKDYMFAFVENKQRRDINTYLNTIKNMLDNARKEIEDSEKYYQHVLDNISSGVIVTNQNNSVMRINSTMKTILGVDNISHINNLSSYYSGMSEAFIDTSPIKAQWFSFSTEREQFKVSIQLSLWERGGKILKIYTVNNISNELEYKELDSWNRLTRVLTHEIMNSLTPIISISSALVESKKINDPDIEMGLNVIATTSSSLVKFVDNYRQLSRIATPAMMPIYVKNIVDSALGLYDNVEQKIVFEINISQEDLMIYVDEAQILQIVINLLKNAVESIGDRDGTVTIDAYCEKNEDVVIKVSDSGARIPNDVAENIFIPFFTTKTGGSGIGLSISRQIMRLHNGSISLIQTNNQKSFLLTFR